MVEITVITNAGYLCLQLRDDTTTTEAVGLFFQAMLGLEFGRGALIKALEDYAEEALS